MIRSNNIKLTTLSLALLIIAGCSSTDSDTSGETTPPVATNTAPTTTTLSSSTNNSHVSDADARRMAMLLATNTFYFKYDSADLRPEAMESLDAHAKALKATGNHVVLEGHTDERGTREYNMALGERRAQAVQRYLVLQGVPANQLSVVSYGEENPAVVGDSPVDLEKNRRVEMRK